MSAKADHELSMADLSTASFGSSTRTLVKKSDWRKSLSYDLWWKITITLAVIVIAGFIIYKVVDDSNKSSTKTNLSHVSGGQKSTSERAPKGGQESSETSATECKDGSIKGSNASFTYLPFNSYKLYTTHGLEFSFDDVKRKPGVESAMTEQDPATAATSKIHYYYNIPRCRIGGGLQLDIDPYIRGPIVFAVDEQCTKAYYFLEDKGWIEYLSKRNLKCSAHGKEEKRVDEAKCLEGSIKDSDSTFVYTPFGSSKRYRASGVEFSFEIIAKKTKLGSRLTKLNKLIASTSKIHYYYNIPRCRIGGGFQLEKEPYIRGPIVFAVDEQCTQVYYFIEGRGWFPYQSSTNITCSSHGENNKTKCFKGSIHGAYSTFTFNVNVNVTGIQYNFTVLDEKLQDLVTDFNLTKIPELTSDTSYYLNLHRCYNGGPANMNVNPQIRGPIIFAINNKCTTVHYLSSASYQWKPYKSARNINCKEGSM